MSRKFRFLKSFSLLFFILLISLNNFSLAQESVRINKANLSEGITLELDTGLFTQSANFLAIGDTSNQQLALSNFVLNDQNIWIKNSDEEVVNTNNAVHWYYSEDLQILFVNLTGVKEAFLSGTNLQLTILTMNSTKSDLSLSIFEALTDSENSPADMQKIGDLNVVLK